MRIIDIGLSIPEFVIMIALASFFILVLEFSNSYYNHKMDELYSRDKRDCQYRNESIVYTDGTIFNVSTLNILFKHLLPKVLPSIFVIMIVDFGKSFYTLVHYHFRFSAQPPSPEWGQCYKQGVNLLLHILS